MISGGTSNDGDNYLISLGLSGILIEAIRNRRRVARQVVSISGRLICHKRPRESAGVTDGKRAKTPPHTPGPSDKNPIEAERLQIRVECGSGEGRLGLFLLVEGAALLADLHHPRAGHDHLGPDQLATALAVADRLPRSALASHLLYLALSHF